MFSSILFFFYPKVEIWNFHSNIILYLFILVHIYFALMSWTRGRSCIYSLFIAEFLVRPSDHSMIVWKILDGYFYIFEGDMVAFPYF